MSYNPISIKDIIKKIENKTYALPIIQRTFIWSEEQIETLFDSIMRDYPIGTFLFWEVGANYNTYQFYSFLTKYDERNQYNNEILVSPSEHTIAILDGQQRLISLYLGLCGSYTVKKPYQRRNSNNVLFTTKYLYLNLLQPSTDSEMHYNFKFMDANAIEQSATSYWFRVSDILKDNFQTYQITHEIVATHQIPINEANKIGDTITKLLKKMTDENVASYYLAKSDKTMDEVLQIFVRTNSGGTKLSYSDLLLSVATAAWKDPDTSSQKNFREIIYEFIDTINNNYFNFDKDFVLKACLVLSDLKDIGFNVKNFTKPNVLIIQNKWKSIAEAISITVELIKNLNYNRKTLTTNNALIPIAYFIMKTKDNGDIINSIHREQDRNNIRIWLATVILKNWFGRSTDNYYPKLREIMNNSRSTFPWKEIRDAYQKTSTPLIFTDDELDNLLELKYGENKTYSLLSLLYHLDPNRLYSVDHMHPQSLFNKNKLIHHGVNDSEQIKTFIELSKQVVNLQLLRDQHNHEKLDMPLKQWIDRQHPTYFHDNFIEENTSLEVTDFIDFCNIRKHNMKQKLKEILSISIQ